MFFILFLNSCYTRGQVSAKPVQVHHVVHDDRLLKVEQDRADLQRTLLQSSSQFDQLSSENYGLTVAMDELRRKCCSFDSGNVSVLVS